MCENAFGAKGLSFRLLLILSFHYDVKRVDIINAIISATQL